MSDSSPNAAPRGRITREDGCVVIRVPEKEVHSLRVALEPCPCRSSKSNATASIRQRLLRALTKAAG